MHEAHIQSLMKAPLLEGYTEHGVRSVLESGSVKEHAAGEALFAEGDKPVSVFLVIAGGLEVYVSREGQDIVVNRVGPGDIVGELAVLCGRPRSASVRTTEPSVLLRWDPNAFRDVLLGDFDLSERIFGKALRTLVDQEKALVEQVLKARRSG